MSDTECLGHPAGPLDPMGETVYCDGSCRKGAVDSPFTSTIEEFVAKYGTEGASLLVEAYVERSPAFAGAADLAKALGAMVGDLQSALEDVARRVPGIPDEGGRR